MSDIYLPQGTPLTQGEHITTDWYIPLQKLATQALIGNIATSHLNSGTSASIGTLWRGDATWASIPYLNYQDQKTQNTAGGTFTSGAWQTRTLNTEVSDTDNLGTLSGNQITLSAGTYRIHATAQGYSVDRNQLRLQNVTDATTILLGQNQYAGNANPQLAESIASVSGVFTIGASKALELQHQCTVTKTSNGFGVECNFTTEVYAVVELWRVG